MKTLQVTTEWLNYFREKRVELITTIDNRELFEKTIEGSIKGNQLDYATKFRLIETFIDEFPFMKIESIRLVWSEELDNDQLQFFQKEDDFENWKSHVLKGNYVFENLLGADYEDPTEIFYNYSVDAEGRNSSLYTFDQFDRTAIYIWYHPTTDTTHYSINIELRKALFFQDKYQEMQLPDDCLTHNRTLLTQMDNFSKNG